MTTVENWSYGSTPYVFLRDSGEEQKKNYPGEKEEVLGKEGRRSDFICLVCGETITSKKRTMSFGGSHAHTFFNPHGIVFELGCFSAAPGCFCQGPITTEFSWFKGYAWEFSLCGGCGEHLGWHYLSAENDFFGLILNKIVLREAP